MNRLSNWVIDKLIRKSAVQYVADECVYEGDRPKKRVLEAQRRIDLLTRQAAAREANIPKLQPGKPTFRSCRKC